MVEMEHRKWVNWNKALASLAGREPNYRDDYERTVANKHNKGRPRDRVGRFEDRPRQDERADDRDKEDRPDREDDE